MASVFKHIFGSFSIAFLALGVLLVSSCTHGTIIQQKITAIPRTGDHAGNVKLPVVRPSLQLSPLDQQRYQTFFLEGIAQELKGNYAAAYDLLEHARTINPYAAEAYFHLARFYIDTEQDSIAQTYFEKAAELAPDNDTYVEKVGEMYINQRKYQEAINIYEGLYATNRKRYDVLQLLLQLYAMQNDHANMLETLNRMEVLEGSNEQISFSKMQIYEQLGKKDKAYNELKALVDKHPNDLNFQVMLGNWLLQNGQAEEAVKRYRTVLKQEPDNSLAQMSMLDYYREKGMATQADMLLLQLLTGKKTPEDEKLSLMRQYVLAAMKEGTDSTKILSFFNQVLDASPSAEMLLMKAAYMNMTEIPRDSVYAVYQDILAIEPDHLVARMLLVQNLWNMEKYQRVIELCQRGQEYNPDEMYFYYFEGFAHFQLDEKDEALEVFRKGTAQIKDDSDADIVSDFYSMMGDLLHEKGQDEEAFDAYENCLKWKPDNIGALNNYAYYLSLKGQDLQKAEQMSLKTVQSEPTNSNYLDTYAWILFIQERYDEAKIYIDQAIANEKESSAVIMEHAGDIYAMTGDIPTAMEFWLKAKDLGSDSTTIDRKIKQKKYINE